MSALKSLLVLGVVGSLAALGCAAGVGGPRPSDYSAERSFEDAQKLASWSPRAPGSIFSQRAGDAIAASLRQGGVGDIRQLQLGAGSAGPGGGARHVLGILPGRSSDILVLSALRDTPAAESQNTQAALARASGAALLLELARVFGDSDRPYTLWFVFLDDAATRDAPGAQSWAAFLDESGRREQVRAVVHFAGVAAPKVRIGRDLRSQGIYREVFFDAAIALGHRAQFPRSADLVLPDGPHRALLGRGMGHVVAMVNVAEPPDEAPGSPASEAAARANLEAVGQVSILAVDRIARDLERADRLGGAWAASENPPVGIAADRRR